MPDGSRPWPSAVPKTVRPSSCVIQLFAVRGKSSLSSLQDDLGKSVQENTGQVVTGDSEATIFKIKSPRTVV